MVIASLMARRRTRQQTKTRRRALAAGAVVLLLAMLIVVVATASHYGTLMAWARKPSPFWLGKAGTDDAVAVVIPAGAGPRDIARMLAKKGVIGDSELFYRWVRYVMKKENAMKAGEYELSPSMTPEQILAVLESGRMAEVRVTVPEGLRKEDVARVLAEAGLCAGDAARIVDVMNEAKTVAALGVPAEVPGGIDGYLFPDTYRFEKNATPEKILKRMRERLNDVVDSRMRERMRELGWDLHKTLTLAAIVEKETGAAPERAHISAVFHNRLKRGMKLQTDPTVIYGIPHYDGNIRKADLVRAHPYNTYVIEGLPPGPIAQPGRAAMQAALWPIESDDVFFVARGDSGEHEFCPTLDCHNAAVQKWQVEFWAKRKRGG